MVHRRSGRDLVKLLYMHSSIRRPGREGGRRETRAKSGAASLYAYPSERAGWAAKQQLDRIAQPKSVPWAECPRTFEQTGTRGGLAEARRGKAGEKGNSCGGGRGVGC